MLTIVCWLWDDGSLRSKCFEPVHVNVLQRMVARHLAQPHRFVCITDATEGFSPDVEVMPTPAAARQLGLLRSPEGQRFPSCYRRLWLFSDEAKCLGERVLLLDVDLVVTGALDPILEHESDFVGWRPYRDWGAQMRFGGGIYLLTPGSRRRVWDEFDGPPAIATARQRGYRGSDQAWISYQLGDRDPYWGRDAGIYSIRDLKEPNVLPPDARLVQLNGPTKPWSVAGQRIPWVAKHWR